MAKKGYAHAFRTLIRQQPEQETRVIHRRLERGAFSAALKIKTITTVSQFDQQPVEACATVSACQQVYRLTKESRWQTEASRAFRWFLGKNDLLTPLYDPSTGGCRDGLHPDRVNENQGAESTLSFLMALLDMQVAEVANVDELHQEMSVSS